MIICARCSCDIPPQQVKEFRKFISVDGEVEEIVISPVCEHCLGMLESPYREQE